MIGQGSVGDVCERRAGHVAGCAIVFGVLFKADFGGDLAVWVGVAVETSLTIEGDSFRRFR